MISRARTQNHIHFGLCFICFAIYGLRRPRSRSGGLTRVLSELHVRARDETFLIHQRPRLDHGAHAIVVPDGPRHLVVGPLPFRCAVLACSR